MVRWTPEETERLVQLKEEGYKATDIADMLGRDIGSVRGKLKQLARASGNTRNENDNSEESCKAIEEYLKTSDINEDDTTELELLRKQYKVMETALVQRTKELFKYKRKCAEYAILARLIGEVEAGWVGNEC